MGHPNISGFYQETRLRKSTEKGFGKIREDSRFFIRLYLALPPEEISFSGFRNDKPMN